MTPTILILTPVLMPVVKAAGIDPVYFGVMFIINNSIGLVTPPVGAVLNVVAGVGRMKHGRGHAGRGAVHGRRVRRHVPDGGVPGAGDGAGEAVRGVRSPLPAAPAGRALDAVLLERRRHPPDALRSSTNAARKAARRRRELRHAHRLTNRHEALVRQAQVGRPRISASSCWRTRGGHVEILFDGKSAYFPPPADDGACTIYACWVRGSGRVVGACPCAPPPGCRRGPHRRWCTESRCARGGSFPRSA